MQKVLMAIKTCLFKADNFFKNIMKSGIKSTIVSKKGFDGKPVYIKKYLKRKIKF